MSDRDTADGKCPRCGGEVSLEHDIICEDGGVFATDYDDKCPHCGCELLIDVIVNTYVVAQSRYSPNETCDADEESIKAARVRDEVSAAYKWMKDKILSDADWKAWFIEKFGNQWNYSYQMLDPCCISLANFIHDQHPEFDWMMQQPKPATWDDIPDDLRIPFRREIIEDLQGRGWDVTIDDDNITNYTLEMAIEDWKNQCGEKEVVDYIIRTRYAIY